MEPWFWLIGADAFPIELCPEPRGMCILLGEISSLLPGSFNPFLSNLDPPTPISLPCESLGCFMLSQARPGWTLGLSLLSLMLKCWWPQSVSVLCAPVSDPLWFLCAARILDFQEEVLLFSCSLLGQWSPGQLWPCKYPKLPILLNFRSRQELHLPEKVFFLEQWDYDEKWCPHTHSTWPQNTFFCMCIKTETQISGKRQAWLRFGNATRVRDLDVIEDSWILRTGWFTRRTKYFFVVFFGGHSLKCVEISSHSKLRDYSSCTQGTI